MKIKKKIGKRIQELRQKNGLKQSELAEKSTITSLHRLAKYFKINFCLSFATLLLLLLTSTLDLYIFTNNILLSLIFVVLYSSKELIKVLFNLFVGKIVEI